jgi:6,7-dimethyl-8-ribityllumazine synthase
MAQQTLPRRPRLIGPRKTFAIVASMYNEKCMDGLLESTKAELLAIMPTASVPLYRVPGAGEIPVCAEYVLQHTHADVVIALGVVIRGETSHADLIASSVATELQSMSCRHLTPIVNMVLLVSSQRHAGKKKPRHHARRQAARIRDCRASAPPSGAPRVAYSSSALVFDLGSGYAV